MRLRIGRLAGWHGSLRIGDGAPFTSEGASYGLRMLLGAPAVGRHRLTAGVYTTLGENTAGVTGIDKLAARSGAYAWRVGALVGCVLGHASRVEASAFVGVVW